MDRYRTIRYELFEVWEDGAGEFPLFVCSDGSVVRDHIKVHPTDTFTRRFWVREGVTP